MLIQSISNFSWIADIYQVQSSLIIFTTFLSKAILGLPSTVQNLQLNKMEIGQFLYMKYMLIGAKPHKNKISAVVKFSGAFFKTVSAIANAVGKLAKIAYPNKYGLCSSVKICPSLLAKVRVFMNLVPLNIFNIKGTPIIVSQKKTVDQYENTCDFCPKPAIIAVIADPKLIPNQNRKFHNLSLVRHLSCLSWVKEFLLAAMNLAKSCIIGSYCDINFHDDIIPKMSGIIKQKAQLLWSISNAEKKEYNIQKWLLLAVAKIIVST